MNASKFLLAVLVPTTVLTLCAQDASAVPILPNATASLFASSSTVGGVDVEPSPPPTGDELPLPVAAASGGNSAFPTTSGFAKASVSVSGNNRFPETSVSVEAKGTGGVSAQGQTVQAEVQANASLSYTINPFGPTGVDTTILIHSTITKNVTIDSNNYSTALFIIIDPESHIMFILSGNGSFDTPTFEFDGSVDLTANITYTVLIAASAFVDAVGNNTTDLVAFVDPTFTPEDPAYTILYSPNLLPSTVPLPATLPLFASGLAGLGWLGRRRRKQPIAA